jgi:hypothetical protein
VDPSIYIKILFSVNHLKWWFSQMFRGSDGHDYVPSLVTAVHVNTKGELVKRLPGWSQAFLQERTQPCRIYYYFKRLLLLSMAWQPNGPRPSNCWGFDITLRRATHFVGLRWTRDCSVAENCTWQHTTLTTDRHPCPRGDSNPQSQPARGRKSTP